VAVTTSPQVTALISVKIHTATLDTASAVVPVAMVAPHAATTSVEPTVLRLAIWKCTIREHQPLAVRRRPTVVVREVRFQVRSTASALQATLVTIQVLPPMEITRFTSARAVARAQDIASALMTTSLITTAPSVAPLPCLLEQPC